jgi:hypothetical protein
MHASSLWNQQTTVSVATPTTWPFNYIESVVRDMLGNISNHITEQSRIWFTGSYTTYQVNVGARDTPIQTALVHVAKFHATDEQFSEVVMIKCYE